MSCHFSIRPINSTDREWLLEIVRGWGSDFIVTRGRKVYAAELPGLVAVETSGKRVGVATYEIIDDQCEMVTLDAFEKFSGIGSALCDHVKQAALAAGCKRLWLITTNDNLDAIRFYQRRGFTIAAIHKNALEHSRQLKPSIPKIGAYNIALRDEIEFEMTLGE